MTKKVIVKEGDIFEVPLNNNKKGYFQFIMLDTTQLNSEVIRVFNKQYTLNEKVELNKVAKDTTQFYSHVNIKIGIKMGHWEKVGNVALEQNIEAIYFKKADDATDPSVKWKKSLKWYIWKVGEDFKFVGSLSEKHEKYDIGLVINPLGLIEIMNGNKYPPYYPE